MTTIFVNGEAKEVAVGSRLLTALSELGLQLPHLCHDERLAPAGACRLCSVEIDGGRPTPSCAVTVREGMRVSTHSEPLESHRRMSLRELARSLPRELASARDTPLLRQIIHYGLEGELGRGRVRSLPLDDSHPYLRVDMARCVSCFRCQRICADVQGQYTWHAWGRGAELSFRPDSGTTLRDSSCVSCGACADSCPSGAIEDRTLSELGEPTAVTRTTCGYCGVGCEMLVGTREGRIVQVRPALDAKVNAGHLCVKGRYAFAYGEASDRVTSPRIRRGRTWHEVSWDEALSYVARELSRIITTHGPDSCYVLGSARATNEDNYVTQKLSRVALGTNNVDCCARVCHAPSAAALGAMLGTGAATSSFDDIERAKVILVLGANPSENHPVLGARIKQAIRHGARSIVIDPRRTELAAQASLHLQVKPGADVLLLHALACAAIEEDLVDHAFIAQRVDGFEAYRAHVAAFSPERVAEACGIDASRIREAARLYASSGPALAFHGLGVTEHTQGTETVMCIVNLALITGNVGKPGAGVNPLRGQNNVQGSAHMGCEPSRLTGYVPLEEGRERFERVWQAPLPRSPGLDLMEMLDAADGGKMQALYAIGYDLLLTNPDATTTHRALSKLSLVVVQDLFMTETAREHAHVFLPAASNFEKDGTFMNAERRIQRVRAALPAPGQARADWQILCALAAQLGHAERFAWRSPEQIWDEIRSVWPAGAGIDYARLEEGGLQWPCPSEEHPGTPILHAESFRGGPRASLRCIEPRTTPELCTPDYPLLLITGRRLYQLNAATMTSRTRNQELQPEDVLDVSAEDALRFSLASGDLARVVSRYGEVTLRVNVVDNLRAGELFTTFHTARVFLNRVTSPHRDSVTHTPEYKRTAVRLYRA